MSQTQNHTEALDNAKKSCKIVHQLFKDLLMLCALYVRKIERKEVNKGVKSGDKLGSKAITDEEDEGEEVKIAIDEMPMIEPKNFLEESISMLERTSK